jgi:hypothetical protein
MRAFDNWNFYFDKKKNLLHGKIFFCKKGTTEPIAIYNSDGVAIRNPAFTNSLGRTEYQVFLDDDVDVTAYYYRYIGVGDMMTEELEDFSPERWSYQYSLDSLAYKASIDFESNVAIGVPNMQALRTLDVNDVPDVNGKKVVWLYGYYTTADTSPVMYAWDSESTLADDGGSVIQPLNLTAKGRWCLVNKELQFDVRHFGVMPTNDIYSNDYSYTSQLANCARYINANGCDAWFPAISNELSYYLLDGSNAFVINGNIYASRNTRFACKDGTNGSRIECKQFIKNSLYLFDSSVKKGSATLVADELNISWLGDMVQGIARNKFVIDTDEFQRIIQQKQVEFLKNGHPSLQLIECEIVSRKAITGRIAISSSVINTSYFADDYNYSQLLSASNTILLDNCDSATTYIQLKNKQNESDYGDLKGQVIQGVTLLDGCVLFNAIVDNVTIAGVCDLNDVDGNVSIDGSGNTITASNCYLTLNNGAVLGECVFNGGSVTCDTTLSFLRNVSFNGVAIDSALEILGGVLSLKNSDIKKTITHKGKGTISQSVQGCNLSAKIKITATEADTLINAVWTNNYASVENPIDIDRVNIAQFDSLHSYIYEGNSGGFLPSQNSEMEVTLTQAAGYSSFYRTDDRINILAGVSDVAAIMLGDLSYKANDGGASHGFSSLFKIFRVGYNSFVAKVKWQVTNRAAVNSNAFDGYPVNSAIVCNDFTMTAIHRGGYEYKLNVIEQASTTQDNASVAFTNIGNIWNCNANATQAIHCLMSVSPL